MPQKYPLTSFSWFGSMAGSVVEMPFWYLADIWNIHRENSHEEAFDFAAPRRPLQELCEHRHLGLDHHLGLAARHQVGRHRRRLERLTLTRAVHPAPVAM